jgi:hypothetical protein
MVFTDRIDSKSSHNVVRLAITFLAGQPLLFLDAAGWVTRLWWL